MENIIASLFTTCKEELKKAASKTRNIKSEPEATSAAYTLVENALQGMGCSPEKIAENTLIVKYQGATFEMQCTERYCRIWDTAWTRVKTDDPELPNIREAVNITNFCFGPALVMTAPTEDSCIDIHSRYDIMLHPDCPDTQQYVSASLDLMFDTRRQLIFSWQSLKGKQQDAQRARRPVGFATGTGSAETPAEDSSAESSPADSAAE